jgi:hypothetical protein
MNTAALPGWLQLTLVWLCGVVGWLLLRPYRRITQLGGKSPIGEIANIGGWHKKFFSDLKGVAIGAAGAAIAGDIEAQDSDDAPKRKRADNTKDSPAPAAPGPIGTDERPTVSDPAPDSSPTPSPTEQPTPEQPRRTGTPVPAGADDSRVWVPSTGRYADGGNEYDDLPRTVGRGDQVDAEPETTSRRLPDRSYG